MDKNKTITAKKLKQAHFGARLRFLYRLENVIIETNLFLPYF